jgi:hypothetical protein
MRWKSEAIAAATRSGEGGTAPPAPKAAIKRAQSKRFTTARRRWSSVNVWNAEARERFFLFKRDAAGKLRAP